MEEASSAFINHLLMIERQMYVQCFPEDKRAAYQDWLVTKGNESFILDLDKVVTDLKKGDHTQWRKTMLLK
ncbi:hypothetical protein J18TS1_25350 [Oceanobacillus oncorhynchi subsp. incaldanensis]|nr:hypothetical protein J18TS1_25350 [Oceanobacillus oncorhynchi subsp. incaldanensis]